MKVKQLRYSKDNFAYIIYSRDEAIAIDPGCPDDIISFLEEEKLELINILNTHSHFDHIGGNDVLEERTGIHAINYHDLLANRYLYVGDSILEVMVTPGHTEDSVCFKGEDYVITGDTLFIANAGNCSSSLIEAFKASLNQLMLLPEEFIVYPGHDYTERSIIRAMEIDPKNQNIKKFRDKFNPPPVCSTIGEEKKINPYLRTGKPAILEYLKEKNQNIDNELECFKSFMKLY